MQIMIDYPNQNNANFNKKCTEADYDLIAEFNANHDRLSEQKIPSINSGETKDFNQQFFKRKIVDSVDVVNLNPKTPGYSEVIKVHNKNKTQAQYQNFISPSNDYNVEKSESQPQLFFDSQEIHNNNQNKQISELKNEQPVVQVRSEINKDSMHEFIALGGNARPEKGGNPRPELGFNDPF